MSYLQVKISMKCVSVIEDCFILSNSADPNEMPPYAAFQMDFHCLQKYLFTSIHRDFPTFLKSGQGPV